MSLMIHAHLAGSLSCSLSRVILLTALTQQSHPADSAHSAAQSAPLIYLRLFAPLIPHLYIYAPISRSSPQLVLLCFYRIFPSFRQKPLSSKPSPSSYSFFGVLTLLRETPRPSSHAWAICSVELQITPGNPALPEHVQLCLAAKGSILSINSVLRLIR